MAREAVEMPEWRTHRYWEGKSKFLYAQDTSATWVFFAMEEGVIEYRIGDQHGRAGAGDLVICPPGTPFHRRIVEPASFHAVTFTLEAPEAGAATALREQPRLHLPSTVRLLENWRALRMLQALPDREEGELEPEMTSLKRHYLLDLWLMLGQRLERAGEQAGPSEDPLMEEAAHWLRRHAGERVSLKALSARLGLTHVQLIRRFKAAYRLPPLHYLTALRLHKAKALLLESDWTLEAIAAECGYESGYSLSRVFTRHAGLSPSAYRKHHRL
ncbi:helix-turn-helix transcriptional regulator [Paenibacillus sp. IB182496]|uniref:Helix-turn-helix transcriptional regulator n=1 Tax=Paenibacillus sabuli TaxID=2772509 RepID=A0A927BVF6_9BACL|nr:AraC family transcriptional regulator [Paenibacillus sabuli]MBD2846636.1 helix-turn-helix transcriptional regulator [Paenibacillus sabuli]